MTNEVDVLSSEDSLFSALLDMVIAQRLSVEAVIALLTKQGKSAAENGRCQQPSIQSRVSRLAGRLGY